MYQAEREQLARRQKMLDIMAQQAITPQQTQMVSGRAVPQGIAGALSPIIQAMMAKRGGADIASRTKELDTMQAKGVQDAMRSTMDQYTGKPQRPYQMSPEEQFPREAPIQGLESKAIPSDPAGAAMNVATDPRLADNKAAQAMMMQLMKGRGGRGSGSLPKPVAGSTGYMEPVRNPDGSVSWKRMVVPEGKPVLPVAADAANRGAVQAQITENKLKEKLKREAELIAKIQTEKNRAAMGDPSSPQYQKQQKEHSIDLKSRDTSNLKTEQAMGKIDYILNDKNKDAFESNFGGYNAVISQFAPGAAQDMRLKLESLKSDLKMAGLEMIRGGGSIGQMTEREWPIVQNMIDTLAPKLSEPQARAAIENIKTYLTGIDKKADDIYSDRWGKTQFNVGNQQEETKKTGNKPKDLDQNIWDAMTPKEKALFQ